MEASSSVHWSRSESLEKGLTVRQRQLPSFRSLFSLFIFTISQPTPSFTDKKACRCQTKVSGSNSAAIYKIIFKRWNQNFMAQAELDWQLDIKWSCLYLISLFNQLCMYQLLFNSFCFLWLPKSCLLVPVSFSPFQSNRPTGLLQRATKRNKKNPGGEQPGYDTSKNQLKHYPMQDAYFLFSEVSLSNCYHWIDWRPTHPLLRAIYLHV